jgi:hypothetical protein
MGTGPDRRRVALLSTAAVLAVLAGLAVVLAEDARVLRLGVVAALWTVVLVVIAFARRSRDAAHDAVEADRAAEAAEEAEADLAAAEEEAAERLAAVRRDHERRLAREAGAREEAEREAEKAREEAAALREQLERTRVAADAVPLRARVGPPQPRAARLRVVGDSGPQPSVAAVPPPAPMHPAAPAPRSGGAPLRPAPPPRPDVPAADPSVLATGSFVDSYVRSAGYDTPPEPDGRPSRRAHPADAPTTGRTVAELLAAHAASAAAGTGGRRRRDP